MADARDYKLDINGVAPADGGADASPPTADGADPGRPFLSVRFDCCAVYTRIYKTPDGAAYRGRCPRCGKPVNFPVGAGGTDARFFVVR
jgi:hypothetical protein